MEKCKFLGFIDLGNKVMVSDPCYSIGIWCQGTIDNVVSGTYGCYISEGDTDRGHRIKELFITKSDRSISRDQIDTFMDFEVGVDSGTAGIFDYDYYEKFHKDSRDDAFEAWFDKYIIKDRPDYRITSNSGVWSRSGYGDGGYDCFAHIDEDKKVDAIRIIFINDTVL